ncbi:hypothetical protein EVAR_6005_1 [Eumeta japonica]|uniref:Uncharacterized protein n=1 Tax=Eumeta variegata TaxID=151549 RepID=A0A4C1TCK3_EUMVA|nr:hypothetical protein EVAR_6005_1 [Eumeta japonica]
MKGTPKKASVRRRSGALDCHPDEMGKEIRNIEMIRTRNPDGAVHRRGQSAPRACLYSNFYPWQKGFASSGALFSPHQIKAQTAPLGDFVKPLVADATDRSVTMAGSPRSSPGQNEGLGS